MEEWSDAAGIKMARFGVEVRDLCRHGNNGRAVQFTLTDRAEITATIYDRESGRVIIEHLVGTRDAGTVQVDLPLTEEELEGASARNALRITARSTYDGGGSDSRELDLAGATLPILSQSPNLNAQPNPFNPSTTIRFSVSGTTARPGRLDLFDVTGRLVAVMAEGPFSPGSHAFIWNGENNKGRPASSGIYIARLDLNGKISTSNLVLLR